MEFDDTKVFNDPQVFEYPKVISNGSMDLDNPKVYGDTIIFKWSCCLCICLCQINFRMCLSVCRKCLAVCHHNVPPPLSDNPPITHSAPHRTICIFQILCCTLNWISFLHWNSTKLLWGVLCEIKMQCNRVPGTTKCLFSFFVQQTYIVGQIQFGQVQYGCFAFMKVACLITCTNVYSIMYIV